MDVVREEFEGDRDPIFPWGFNPCSNGCRSGRNKTLVQLHLTETVSILVLMDVVREVKFHQSAKTRPTSFNPCSNGCRSGSTPKP